MDRPQNFKYLSLAAIILSVSIHLLTFVSFDFLKMPEAKVKPQVIEFVVSDDKKPTQVEKPKVKIENKVKDVQVVEQNDKSFNDEVPDKKYFLSKNNQRVKVQTKAKNTGDFKNDAGKGQKGRSKKERAKKKKVAAKKKKPKLKEGIKFKNLMPQNNYASAKNFEVNESQSGQRSQSNDYLKDIKEGKQTVLNTREFIYYAYYERIRGKIRYFWEPVIKDKVKHVIKTGRKLASVDHQTAVVITLDKTGSLINVQIKDGSGVRDLDEAAIEAFKEAEPFPNPPKGIIESDGKIRINWNFVLEA